MAGIKTLWQQIQQALMDWKAEVSARQTLLLNAVSAPIYNSIVQDIQLKTFEMTRTIKKGAGRHMKIAVLKLRLISTNLGPLP